MRCDVRVHTRRINPPTAIAPKVRRCESGSGAELPWGPTSIMVPAALWGEGAWGEGVKRRGSAWEGLALREGQLQHSSVAA